MVEQFISAIDFGETYIKLVKACVVGNKLHICGTFKTLTRGVKNGEILSKLELSEAIKELIDQSEVNQVKSENLIVVLPSNRLNVTRKKLEVINDKYPNVTVKEDIEKLKRDVSSSRLGENEMPVALYPITYYSDEKELGRIEPVGDRCKKYGIDAFVCSLPTGSSRAFIDVIEEMKLRVLTATISPLANVAVSLKPNEYKGGAIVLDIGGSGINISAYYNELLYVNYHTNKGINYILLQLMQEFNVNREGAEQILYKYGCASVENSSNLVVTKINNIDVKESDIARVVENSVEMMLGEVKKTFDLFLQESAELPIIVTGGGANIHGMSEKISNYFKKVTYSRGFLRIGGRDYSFNSCIGAIIAYSSERGFIKGEKEG